MKMGWKFVLSTVVVAVCSVSSVGIARALDSAVQHPAPVAAAVQGGPGAMEAGAFGFVEADRVDWRLGLVTASGRGGPPPFSIDAGQARSMAVRAAEVAARRKLLETLSAVFVDASRSVGQAMAANEAARSRVSGLLQNSRVLDTTLDEGGNATVVVGLELRGELADIFLPRVMGAALPSAAAQSGYSGLIVDARGLAANPALMVRILDEDGRELFGPSVADRLVAVEQGMAGYNTTMDSARLAPRSGGRPLLLKAARTSGQNRTDIVLGDSEAALLREGLAGSRALNQCRVVIVLD